MHTAQQQRSKRTQGRHLRPRVLGMRIVVLGSLVFTLACSGSPDAEPPAESPPEPVQSDVDAIPPADTALEDAYLDARSRLGAALDTVPPLDHYPLSAAVSEVTGWPFSKVSAVERWSGMDGLLAVTEVLPDGSLKHATCARFADLTALYTAPATAESRLNRYSADPDEWAALYVEGIALFPARAALDEGTEGIGRVVGATALTEEQATLIYARGGTQALQKVARGWPGITQRTELVEALAPR